MDLHIDDSIVDGQLEDGEEHKQPEPVLLPSISDAKQLSFSIKICYSDQE